MKTTQYVKQIGAIEQADAGGIRERWFLGLRLLRDPEVMSASGKSLRHGVTEQLIAAAGLNVKGKRRVSDQEIQRWIRCARAYPTESQIRRAATDFDTWWKLVDAGFPPYDALEDEPPADHRTEKEKMIDRERDLEDRFGEQGVLFLTADVQPTTSPLKELKAYADDMSELTCRYVERDRKRREYLQALIEAADGDLSTTWQDAHRLAFGEDVTA